MQDAFIKFFTTGDTTQTVVFVILLLISFLLGMLVWALLAHFPASRKLKAENEQSQELLADLQAQQEEKATRELTNLLQDVQFIIEVDSNCPSNDMITTINDLYDIYGNSNTNIESTYEKVMSQLQELDCL